MNLSTTISSIFMAFISILTSCGVAVYDSQFTQVAMQFGTKSAISNPARVVVDNLASSDGGPAHTQHVHSDYNPLHSTLGNGFHYQSPAIAPCAKRRIKQLLNKLEDGGRHAFDDIFMPILS